MTGYWIPVLVWAFEAYLLADALARGSWAVAVTWAPWLALVAGLMFMALWWPALILRDTDLTIRNPIFTYRVEYAAITDARVTTMVRIEAPFAPGRSKRIAVWNAPTNTRRPRRPSAPSQMKPGPFSGGPPPDRVPPASSTGNQKTASAGEADPSPAGGLLTRWHAATGPPDNPHMKRRINLAGSLSVAVPAVACAVAVLM